MSFTDYHYQKNRDPEVMKYFNKEVMDSFQVWNEKVVELGLLDKKTKELVAVACTYMKALESKGIKAGDS
jgi:alkylhydroperoxidase/carboxymuconolactone decarboxylase family protein YurZ